MAHLFPPRLRRILLGVSVAFALLVLAGATYQGVETSLERHRYVRSGGMVDGGPFQLHILCTGKGSPTVVLEAAAGSISSAWAAVQPAVATYTRVCSYDRSGLGWSESDGQYEPFRVPGNLRTLLTNVDEKGPLVIVGHELGAAFARLYADQDPEHTRALVLVDDPVEHHASPPYSYSVAAWPWLARVGILRVTKQLDGQARGLPGEAGGALRAFLNRPDHLTQAAREIARFDEVAAAARATALPASVIVTQVTVASTGLPATFTRTEQVETVTRAIEQTVAEVREHQALKTTP